MPDGAAEGMARRRAFYTGTRRNCTKHDELVDQVEWGSGGGP